MKPNEEWIVARNPAVIAALYLIVDTNSKATSRRETNLLP